MRVAGLLLGLSTFAAFASGQGVHPYQEKSQGQQSQGQQPPGQQPQGQQPQGQKEAPCPVLPPLPEGNCKYLKNQDRPGFDLKSVKGQLDSCLDACKNTDGCRTFAWSDFEGGTCWLKTGGSKPVDKVGVWTVTCELDVPSKVCNQIKDVDFEGNDIASVPSKEPHKCCGICNAYSGCKVYVWSDYNGGTCWLKAGATKAIRKTGLYASSIVALETPLCPFEFDTDFVGNDIANKPAKDAGECCGQCKANKACKAYSWSNWNGGTCWMKSGKGQTISKSGVISAALISN